MNISLLWTKEDEKRFVSTKVAVVVSGTKEWSGEELSPAERKIYEMRPEAKKADWLLGRLAGKKAIRDYLSANEIDRVSGVVVEILPSTEGGLPGCYLDGQEQKSLIFSLSHTNERYGAAVVASGIPYQAVGIDIELIRNFRPDVVAAFCTPVEYQHWLGLPVVEQSIAATALWTLKEAYGKAIKQGLKSHPSQFDALGFLIGGEKADKGLVEARWTVFNNDCILSVLYIIKNIND